MRVRNERQDEFIEKIKAIREEAGQKGLIRQIKAKEKVVFGEILLILFVLLLCSWFFFRLLVLFFLPR